LFAYPVVRALAICRFKSDHVTKYYRGPRNPKLGYQYELPFKIPVFCRMKAGSTGIDYEYPDDGGRKIIRNGGIYKRIYTAPYRTMNIQICISIM
jgi:hypothetical protein